jgi:hypothetical protein
LIKEYLLRREKQVEMDSKEGSDVSGNTSIVGQEEDIEDGDSVQYEDKENRSDSQNIKTSKLTKSLSLSKLPPIEIKMVHGELNFDERLLYNALFEHGQNTMNEWLESGLSSSSSSSSLSSSSSSYHLHHIIITDMGVNGIK